MVAIQTCFTVFGFFKSSYVKTRYKHPLDAKMVRNRSALQDVLAQGASNRDITVFSFTKLI